PGGGTAPDPENYHALVEASPNCVVVHADRQPLFANGRALAFFGREDITQLDRDAAWGLIHPDERPAVAARLASLAAGAPTTPVEVRMRRSDGGYASVLTQSTLVRFRDRDAVMTVFRDITADVETRRDLMASRERLSLALEAAQDGVWDWDVPNGRMVYSRSWAAMLGLELEEIAPDPSTWDRLIHPQDAPRARALLAAHLRGEAPVYETEVRLRHARGHWIWVLDRGKVVQRGPGGEALRMTGTHRDITARKEAELALEVRNRLAETFLTGSGPGIYRDVLALVCAATDSPAGLLGTFDADGDLRVAAAQPPSDTSLVAAERLAPLIARVARLDHAEIEPGRLDLDGGGTSVHGALAVPISTRDQVIGVLVVADRAESYRPSDRAFVESLAGYLAPILQSHLANEITEAHLRQAQKMEALGALAGGIAHDFNNILQAVLGFTTLAREDAPAGSNLARDLDRVLKATRRGEELVRRILLFSRREEQEARPLAAAAVVREAVDLLRPTLPASIALEVQIAPDAGMIVADPAQLGQMLLNLATNAFHAMEDRGGTLGIALARVPAGTNAGIPPALADCDLVALTVADDGSGMDRRTLARLFDPFFTTKDVGKGTGLGLSVVHGIVTAHGGHIRVESAPGRGTEVTVYLPRLPDAAAGAAAVEGYADPARILFVDDEEPIVSVAATMLERCGYAVEGCVGGAAALETLAGDADRFGLLMTDAAMPEIDGGTVLRRWRELRPGAPAIVVTGHDEDAVPAEMRRGGYTAVIRKPFGAEVLAAAVRSALAAADPGPY
ncbi:MAG: PAS domain-containing protein, partial [Candidatus Krumholzibacteriia bacterium]